MENNQVVLIVLDGWGLSPSWGGNALTMNNPKNIDGYWRNYPHTILKALSVVSNGSPVCDSRLGHMLMGTGRKVKSNLERINEEIKSRRFFRNKTLVGAIEWAKKNNSNIHLIGMISDGGVHSHVDHLLSLLDLAKQKNFDRVFIDAITDGTDTGPTDALKYIDQIENKMAHLKIGSFSSIAGRNLAMDRDEHWEKTKRYFNLLAEGRGQTYESASAAVSANYRQGLNDEFIEPGLILQKNGKTVKIQNNDAVILFNFREDRSRQLAKVLIDPRFHKFLWSPKRLVDLYFATFIDYEKNIPAKIVFPDINYPQNLSEILSDLSFRQLKIAESEKYAHVTYFFNGSNEDPYPYEERKIISSPATDSYDKIPAMNSARVANETVRAINSKRYRFILVNFANVDIVAHSGNILAVGQAVQALDAQIKKIIDANLKIGGSTIITADHGNAEQMISLKKNSNGERKTYHTLNPVPFILIKKNNRKNLLQSAIVHDSSSLSKILTAKNDLTDVAPTILEILKIPKPKEMTGHSLLNQLE